MSDRSPTVTDRPPASGRYEFAFAAANLVCRIAAGVIFLWAGLSKAFDSSSTVLAVDAYQVLPRVLVRPVAAALPWIEIALGVFLLLGLFVRFAGVGVAVLSALFIVALAQAKARGLQIDCGCFGPGGSGDGVGWWEIARDLPLLLAGCYLAWRPSGPAQLDTRIGGEVES
jgi:uncharacterized membrane protein YphA (DoxX/SURF4 family)